MKWLVAIVSAMSLLGLGTWTWGEAVHTLCSVSAFPANCTWEFVRYDSSALERKWEANAGAWGLHPCPHMEADRKMFAQWLAFVQRYEKAPRGTVSATIIEEPMSSFTYRNSCSKEIRRIPIEPFAGVGRHPGICSASTDKVGRSFLDKSYLLISRDAMPAPRAFFFDLGASSWSSGLGGASQQWVVEQYEKRGIRFDGIYAWEATPMDSQQIWNEIPAKYRGVYHWMNIPANPAPGHADNPLALLQRVATAADFVVLKIDIDHSAVEHAFVAQLLSTPALSRLVDEGMFEHHYAMHPMLELGWQRTSGINTQTMADGARIFLGLRRLGIRMHVWV